MNWFKNILSLFLVGIISSFLGRSHISKQLFIGEIDSRAIHYEEGVCKKAQEATALFCDLESMSLQYYFITQLDFFHTDTFSKKIALSAVYLLISAIKIPKPHLACFQSLENKILKFQYTKDRPLFKRSECYLI